MSNRPDSFSLPDKLPPMGERATRGAGRSRRLFASLVIVLCLVLGAALILLLKSSFVSPNHANGASPSAAKAREAAKSVIEAAQVYFRQGDLVKQEAVLREAVGQYAGEQDLRVAYAECLVPQKKTAEAYEQYAAAIAIGPDDPRLEFAAGTLASMLRKDEAAMEHFAIASAGEPANPEYALYLGQKQVQNGRADEGKASLLRAANLRPEDARPWGALAEQSLQENNLHLATVHIAKARQLQPEVAAWRVIEARTLKRKGEAEKALTVLNGLDPSQRREAPILRLIGECYGLLQRPGDAAREYAAASDAVPSDPGLAFEAALWFERAGDKVAARTYAGRAAGRGHAEAKTLLAKLGR